MRSVVAVVLGFVMVIVSGCGGAAPSPMRVDKPQRIVSLTLGTDELLAELVPIERIVAVTHFVDDPQSSNVLGIYPGRVVRLDGKDVERVLHLAPDLICVAPYNSPSLLHALERSGLPLHYNNGVTSFDAMEQGILELGQRVGEPGQGRGLCEKFKQRRRDLAQRLLDLPAKPRVLYWFSGSTAGSNTTMHDVIVSAGAVHIGAELGIEGNREISPEQILAADPDVILMARWDANPSQHELERHPILRNLRAVRDGQVVTIDQRYLSSVTHHILEGVEMLARRLHPDRFSEKSP